MNPYQSRDIESPTCLCANGNKIYLEWQREGLFDTLIFSKDDCAQYGFNVQEAEELENLGGKTKTGADEIPLTLLARAIEKNIRIYPIFTEPDYKDKISNYEDVSIEQSVLGQLELGGFGVVNSEECADIVLIVNNFIDKQGELVMNWDTIPFQREFKPTSKPYAIADVRFANGADNNFVQRLFNYPCTENFYGYSGWNTSANSLGSLLAGIKLKYLAKNYDNIAFKKLQIIRLLDDWGYQANVRRTIEQPQDINELMKPYEKQVSEFMGCYFSPNYIFPWNRIFEIEVELKL